MEEIKDIERDSFKKMKDMSNISLMNSMNIILPRDIQNATSLLSSQKNMNKFSWEEEGDNVKILLNLDFKHL
jgi:hypothetical protein